jgi:uncharacterized membrane protein YccC
MRLISLLGACLFGAASLAHGKTLLEESTPTEVLQFHQMLLKRLNNDDVFGLQRGESAELKQSAKSLIALIEPIDAWQDLNEAEQLRVHAIHSDVRGVLSEADERAQQKVCTRERPLGSNLPKVVCRTREELARLQRDAQDAIRETTRTDRTGVGNN